MTFVYDLTYVLLVCLGAPFLLPWLLIRRLRRGPGSLALRERFARPPDRPVAAHCYWIHAVSLGEINAARTLVAELRRRFPACAIAVSASTATGIARAREIYKEHTVFRFPLDFSPCVRRALRTIRPSVIILMELEVWPNFLEIADQYEIPVVIANGRITEGRSMRRFGWPVVRGVARRMFRRLHWVAAQDAVYAERFVRIGVPAERVDVVGSVKYDAAEVARSIDGQEELAAQLTIDRRAPLWVCGSTGPGEEEIILGAYARLLESHPSLQLALIPRRPERFDEVAERIRAAGYACLRRSGKPPLVPVGVDSPRAVFLGDTMGELRRFYALATVVFVGRSLVPMGGSDVMEVAGLAKPMLVGPFTENFQEAVAALREAGACIEVSDAEELQQRVRAWLTDLRAAFDAGDAGRSVILRNRGATTRIVDRIAELAS